MGQVQESEWIEWAGGDRPVHHRQRIDVQFRSGAILADQLADGWRWRHTGLPGDIIAYRVVSA